MKNTPSGRNPYGGPDTRAIGQYTSHRAEVPLVALIVPNEHGP